MISERCADRAIIWSRQDKKNSGITFSYFSLPGFIDIIRAPIYVAAMNDVEISMYRAGRTAMLCDRIVRLAESEIDAVVGAIFDQFPDIFFVEVRDVFRLDSKRLAYGHFSAETIKVTTIRFADHRFDSEKPSEKKIRYFWNRLGRESQAEVRMEFNSPSDPKNIRRIIGFNRKKIEALGRVYGMNEGSERIVLAASGVHGMDASLFVGEQHVAGCILFLCRKTAYLFSIGYSEEFARNSPGFVCLVRCAERLRDMGFAEFNLLYGDAEYKSRLGGVETPLYSYVFYRTPRSWLGPELLLKFALHAIAKPLRRKIRNSLGVLRERNASRRARSKKIGARCAG